MRQPSTRQLRVWLALATAGLALAIAAPASASGEALRGAAIVIDGDTLEVAGTRVRLFGVDAPEGDQVCLGAGGARVDAGPPARAALARLVSGAAISCTPRAVDRYGRTVAQCTAHGRDLGAAMTQAGWARAYARYAKDYIPAEAQARAARRGLWAWRCAAPWDHRRNRGVSF